MSAEKLGIDEVEELYKQLSVTDLAACALVCKTWHEAYQRVRCIPQWVGALSRQPDLADAVEEACKDALGRMRARPDLAFVFATVGEDAWGSADLQALIPTLQRFLGRDVPICGCTGASVIGTSAAGAPVLVEDGPPALSLSLVYFADQCEVTVVHVDPEEDEEVPAVEAGQEGEQQLIVLSTRWFRKLEPCIYELCKGKGRSIAFGGIASNREHGGASTRLFSSEGLHRTGMLACILKPKTASHHSLDAVVVGAGTLAGAPLEVLEADTTDVRRSHIITSVREVAVGGAADNPRMPPAQAIMCHEQLSGIHCAADVTDEGELRPPIHQMENPRTARGGTLVSCTECPEGSYIQAEVTSPAGAGRKVQVHLGRLAKRDEAARAASEAAARAEDDAGVQMARSANRPQPRRALQDSSKITGGALLFSCLGRSNSWYQDGNMPENFEPTAFAAAFPGVPLAGFLAGGEIFGEVDSPPTAPPCAEELAGKSVKELKAMLHSAGVDHSACVEKSDLVQLCLSCDKLPSGASEEEDAENLDEGKGKKKGPSFMHGFTAVFAISTASQRAM